MIGLNIAARIAANTANIVAEAEAEAATAEATAALAALATTAIAGECRAGVPPAPLAPINSHRLRVRRLTGASYRLAEGKQQQRNTPGPEGQGEEAIRFCGYSFPQSAL
jgi:hypothetical protein